MEGEAGAMARLADSKGLQETGVLVPALLLIPAWPGPVTPSL